VEGITGGFGGDTSSIVVLVDGESPIRRWWFTEEVLSARIDVGAGPRAMWWVRAQGVERHHLDLFWDGRDFWIEPQPGCDVTIDGKPLSEWRMLGDGSTVRFGGATLRVVKAGLLAA
jgi:hypothetical protein